MGLLTIAGHIWGSRVMPSGGATSLPLPCSWLCSGIWVQAKPWGRGSLGKQRPGPKQITPLPLHTHLHWGSARHRGLRPESQRHTARSPPALWGRGQELMLRAGAG